MADYSGFIEDNVLEGVIDVDAYNMQPVVAVAEVNTPSVLDPEGILVGLQTFVDDFEDPVTNTGFVGVLAYKIVATFDWFEQFHVIPRLFDFGNLLSNQQSDIEVFSAFRDDDETWSAFINNGGSGITLAGQPVLPKVFKPFEGVQMTLEVDTTGPPNVDTTLDFVFSSVPQTTSVPIEIQRILLLNMPPEKGYVEVLEFVTDIIPHIDGTEQRISPRKNPRQLFEWAVKVEEGREHALFENILFDWQQRTFGLPMWHELTELTVTAAAGATTTLNVDTTDYSDYRVGGLILIYTDQFTFDVGEVSAFTSTTITLTNPVLAEHLVGSYVMPLRTAVSEKVVRGRRWRVGLREYDFKFRVENDNDIDIADTAAFATLNSKVFLDGCNIVSGILSEQLEQATVIVDGLIGKTEQTSNWDRNKRIYRYTFFVKSRQALWELRQLLHALKGRLKSFYVPTFNKDLVPVLPLTSAQNTLDVENVGYTLYNRQRQPRNIIQILFTDGTYLTRTITASAEVDADRETLTLDDVWPSTYAISDVERISYIEEVRFDSDRIRLIHEQSAGAPARVSAPVKTVFG